MKEGEAFRGREFGRRAPHRAQREMPLGILTAEGPSWTVDGLQPRIAERVWRRAPHGHHD